MLEGAAQILAYTNSLASGGAWLLPAAPVHTPTVNVSLPFLSQLQASRVWARALPKGAGSSCVLGRHPPQMGWSGPVTAPAVKSVETA